MPRGATPFFRFKQFTVWHDRTALRVCTEACILGAYTASLGTRSALDIGTGTGLLALMLAQKNPNLLIDAVEIEEQHYQQAVGNVAQSPFQSRISVFQQAIQTWENATQYDLIVSNPPFFAKHLLSPDEKRNRALHAETLSMEELIQAVVRLLKEEGRFVVLLPPYETLRLTAICASQRLYPTRQLSIFSRPEKPLFRQITTFEYQKVNFLGETLYIHDPNGQYSTDFRSLLKDYYLNI